MARLPGDGGSSTLDSDGGETADEDEGGPSPTSSLDGMATALAGLLEAAGSEADVDALVCMLEDHGADVAGRDPAEGLTALHRAAAADNAAGVAAILAFAAGGGGAAAGGPTPLMLASSPALLQHGATPLHLAAQHSARVLQVLLAKADPGGAAVGQSANAASLLGVRDDRGWVCAGMGEAKGSDGGWGVGGGGWGVVWRGVGVGPGLPCLARPCCNSNQSGVTRFKRHIRNTLLMQVHAAALCSTRRQCCVAGGAAAAVCGWAGCRRHRRCGHNGTVRADGGAGKRGARDGWPTRLEGQGGHRRSGKDKLIAQRGRALIKRTPVSGQWQWQGHGCMHACT